ncbi:MAG: peptidoglycan DD-metalloendopeptidase family protein [Oscillospiraceae bacterium]|nr:peptidoglycan DD-metalloendopeptidase family protein [Oscillospiraceae bacterium]
MKTKMFTKTKLYLLTKGVVSALLVCVLLCSSALFMPPTARAESLADLERQYNEIETKMAKNKAEMDKIEQSKITQSQKIDALEAEIGGLDDQIGILDSRINLLNANIGDLNNSIESLDAQIRQIDDKIETTKLEIIETEQSIDDTADTLLQRLAITYMMGDASMLECIMGAKSLASLLTLNQYIQNASEYDNSLIKGLEAEIAGLETLNETLKGEIVELEESKRVVNEKKVELMTRQADVQKSANDLGSKKSKLESSQGSAVSMLKTLNSQSAEYARVQKQLAQEQEKIDRQINEFLAAQGSNASTPPENDGTLIWPMPYDSCYISAYFGQYPSGGPHKGMDICVRGGTHGKNVVAAQSGKVIQSGTDHWSMGNYLILDHGGGLFTAYYHASSLKVSQGATVTQGQVIMLAGSTGNSTGPHLHFEVRVNKNGSVVQVNPMNYYSKDYLKQWGIT